MNNVNGWVSTDAPSPVRDPLPVWPVFAGVGILIGVMLVALFIKNLCRTRTRKQSYEATRSPARKGNGEGGQEGCVAPPEETSRSMSVV